MRARKSKFHVSHDHLIPHTRYEVRHDLVQFSSTLPSRGTHLAFSSQKSHAQVCTPSHPSEQAAAPRMSRDRDGAPGWPWAKHAGANIHMQPALSHDPLARKGARSRRAFPATPATKLARSCARCMRSTHISRDSPLPSLCTSWKAVAPLGYNCAANAIQPEVSSTSLVPAKDPSRELLQGKASSLPRIALTFQRRKRRKPRNREGRKGDVASGPVAYKRLRLSNCEQIGIVGPK